jgi:hypothetical protein
MPATYEPIQTISASGSTGVIEFTSISQSYTDLILVSNTYSSTASYGALVSLIGVGNGTIDTGNNYSYTYIRGDGGTATTARVTNAGSFGAIYTGTAQSGSNNWSTCIMQFQNYSNTTTRKTVLWRDNNATGNGVLVDAGVGLWRSNSAINRIKITLNVSQNYAVGSTFTIYGIKAA